MLSSFRNSTDNARSSVNPEFGITVMSLKIYCAISVAWCLFNAPLYGL
jgi:hypothetical protein